MNDANLNITDKKIEIDYIQILSVESAKLFFGPISQEERVWRNEVYFRDLELSPRSKLGIGEHDRAESYIFGNGLFPNYDFEAHQSHFPISVKVMKINELFLITNEMLDLSVDPSEFPWDIGDSEIYLHLSVKKLILSEGTKLCVNGNVFILNCTELIGNEFSNGFTTIELGTSDKIQQRSFRSNEGKRKGFLNGANGVNGNDGVSLSFDSTPIGVRVINRGNELNGKNGSDGMSGLKGSNGRNGAMFYLADLRFEKINGFRSKQIHINTIAGIGFSGSEGGDGGNGGNGGNGADGKITPFGLVSGGSGGKGGSGGNGGDGGKGGNGGICCDVFVSVPSFSSYTILTNSSPAFGGNGGKGGRGGQGGQAGRNGLFFANETESYSQDGNYGNDGSRGKDGKTRNGSTIHIYEKR